MQAIKPWRLSHIQSFSSHGLVDRGSVGACASQPGAGRADQEADRGTMQSRARQVTGERAGAYNGYVDVLNKTRRGYRKGSSGATKGSAWWTGRTGSGFTRQRQRQTTHVRPRGVYYSNLPSKVPKVST
jgi:hypothetical protein